MAVAGIFLIFIPKQSELVNQIAQGIIVLCGVIIGIFAKDSSVTGTALNPRAQVQGLPTPAPSPTAKVEIAAIAEADPALKFKTPKK
jgi:hypothetical protein